jgi:hypothetical protein
VIRYINMPCGRADQLTFSLPFAAAWIACREAEVKEQRFRLRTISIIIGSRPSLRPVSSFMVQSYCWSCSRGVTRITSPRASPGAARKDNPRGFGCGYRTSNPRSRQAAKIPLLNGRWQAIPCNGQIGYKPDHNIRFEIWLLREDRCRVSGISEHFELAVAVGRQGN